MLARDRSRNVRRGEWPNGTMIMEAALRPTPTPRALHRVRLAACAFCNNSLWTPSSRWTRSTGNARRPKCPGSSGVEQWIENPRVGGSIPPPGTIASNLTTARRRRRRCGVGRPALRARSCRRGTRSRVRLVRSAYRRRAIRPAPPPRTCLILPRLSGHPC